MTRHRSSRIFFALMVVALLMLPAATAFAATGPSTPPPVPVVGPRLSPPPIPVSSVISPDTVYNNLLVPAYLPPQSAEANTVDAGRTQQAPGRGIRQTVTSISNGLTLYPSATVCNDFNGEPSWASTSAKTDIWTDWYAGWAPFAIDSGLYQAKNVTFAIERSVGPGANYGSKSQSLKIHADHQPYAAGVGSPLVAIPAGSSQVMVSAKYLIWDHDQGGKAGGPDGMDYDWASMGVKADAYADSAVYVNGYVRGEWAELVNTVDLAPGAQYVMVLLQGQSPGSFNSNIYFDDVKIAFVDAAGTPAYVQDCKLAAK